MNENKKNISKAIVYLLIAGGMGIAFLYMGVPLLARLAIFLGDSKKVEQQTDQIAPAAPRLAPSKDWTNKEQIEVKGFTEAEAEVVLYLNDVESGRVVADQSGEFVFGNISIVDGPNLVYVIAKDAAGNESQKSGILKVNLDTEAPKLTLDGLTDGMTISGSDKKDLKISGLTEEGANVRINERMAFVDGEDFSANLTLADGEQDIKIEATDKAGNKTEKIVTIIYKP